MTYILFFIVVTAYGSTSMTAEFETLAACQAAENEIWRQQGKMVMFEKKPILFCAAKGSK